jgi:ABC-type transport system substrate-binding protein
MLLQAACAPTPPPAPAQPAAGSAESSKPAAGAGGKSAEAARPTGTLRVALNGEPPTIDPALSNDIISGPLITNTFATLVDTDPAGKLVPSLAQSWTTSQDGTVFTFKLVPTAKFHNGEPIEAKDVKWSWERALNPATKSPTARETLGAIVGALEILDGKATELTGVKIVDPHTLEVTLSLPMRGDLLTNLTTYATAVVHRPTVENAGDRWFEKSLVGSGPFKLKEWQHNTKVVLEAFPDYYLGSPKVATVELPIVTDASTELAQYENGELDIGRVPLADLKRVRADSQLSQQLLEFDRAQTVYLALNQAVWEPARKLEVRQAIAHSIDKKKLVDELLFGAGKPSYNSIPPGIDGYDPDLKGLEFDPVKAKELMARAGYAGGQGLSPMTIVPNPNMSVYRPMVEAIAGMLKEHAGIQAQVQFTEFARFTADMNKKDVLPVFLTGWSAGILDPNYHLDRLYYGSSATNRMGFKDAEYDKLVDDANRLPPGPARTEAFRKANTYLATAVPAVQIASSRYVFLKKPYVAGLETTPLSWGMQAFDGVTVTR